MLPRSEDVQRIWTPGAPGLVRRTISAYVATLLFNVFRDELAQRDFPPLSPSKTT